jgi:hypothetical protein
VRWLFCSTRDPSRSHTEDTRLTGHEAATELASGLRATSVTARRARNRFGVEAPGSYHPHAAPSAADCSRLGTHSARNTWHMLFCFALPEGRPLHVASVARVDAPIALRESRPLHGSSVARVDARLRCWGAVCSPCCVALSRRLLCASDVDALAAPPAVCRRCRIRTYVCALSGLSRGSAWAGSPSRRPSRRPRRRRPRSAQRPRSRPACRPRTSPGPRAPWAARPPGSCRT